jgi:hypothetical protein
VLEFGLKLIAVAGKYRVVCGGLSVQINHPSELKGATNVNSEALIEDLRHYEATSLSGILCAGPFVEG